MDTSTLQTQEQEIILPSAPLISVVLRSYVHADIKHNDKKLSPDDLLKYIIEYYTKRGATKEEIESAITESLLELRLEYP